ncbi:unnamed protein product [Adineta ricciae]|uniref:Fibronectin type-III domain-containing protein n=1 Tax=Adineta ricciae TaxID=249248 RepID=A0A815JMK9_ADIRI|nr:unnamed protein product [Adineta ricciae]CAF1412331.1 unnamed protein product [Adineta ricciae]
MKHILVVIYIFYCWLNNVVVINGSSAGDVLSQQFTKFAILQAVRGDEQVVLTWNAVPAVLEYVIEYGTSSQTYTKTLISLSSSLTITGLDNGFTYYFRVTARLITGATNTTSEVSVRLPRLSGLRPRELGLLINDNDPESVMIGEYYRTRRHIPSQNIVHLNVSIKVQLSSAEFLALKDQVDRTLPTTVQALAIAWTIPYRVECNSITSAFALNYMDGPCKASTCNWAASSPYYKTNSTKPFTDFKMRPAMMLAALTADETKSMINRGIASDGTHPRGSAYIMNTTDSLRSLRARIFPVANLGTALSSSVNVQIRNADWISNTTDALFYFQGLASVINIDRNEFPPGAIGDHLTSFGGMLTDSYQMSALKFIAGGTTGTFGTVTEPCAYAEKFPDPTIMIQYYTKGETLIEAYWKSILQTFQGIFVGEPLANPWKQEIV